MKKIVIYLSSLILLLNSILIFNLTAYASENVPSEYKARAHGTSFSSLQWNYDNVNKYYIIDNPEGITPSVITSPQYFYTADNVTFFKVTGSDLIMLILNRGLSIVFKPEIASAFTLAFFNSIHNSIDPTGNYVKSAVYDGQRNFLGYALNDITGCYYEGIDLPENTPAINIPSYQTNNVKNFYDYYNKENYPDFINVKTISSSFILNKIKYPNTSEIVQQLGKEAYTTDLPNALENNQNLFGLQMVTNGTSNNNSFGNFYFGHTNIVNGWAKLNNCYYIQTTSGSYWNNFCSYYELYNGNNEVLSTDIYSKANAPTSCYIQYYAYDKDSNNRLTSIPYDTYNVGGTQQDPIINKTQGNLTNTYFWLGRYNNHGSEGIQYYLMIGKDFTIYKDSATYNSINVDKDYEPTQIQGTNYYNYNTNSDNTITTTQQQIDNSITVNQEIYEDNSQIVTNNTTNGTVDSGQISIDVNVSIEQVYPTPTTPDNPSDPDIPSDPDNPLEDDTILDAILAALRRFFEIIGRILGTILSGLLEVIDTVLEAIAGIMENLTGVTEFIAALFSWIPDPVPQILAAGISICILAAIFKFIRG